MKAIGVFSKDHTVRMVAHKEPKILHPTDVKLQMLDVGVCGTDREICAFDYGSPPQGEDYLVLGHESLARVVAIGAGVSQLKVGDLAVTMVRRPCLHESCIPCRSGRQDFCETGDFTERGIKDAHGFMTEFIVEDQQFLHVVPAAFRDVMVLVEPLTIAEKALTQVWQVQQRLPWACPVIPGKSPGYCHKAVVLGAGPVGLLGAMVLTSAAFDTYVYSREPMSSPKAQLVAEIGATYVSGETDSVADLADRVGNIDVVYEAAGASVLSFELMKFLGTNGIFIFTGVPGRKAPAEVDTDLIMRNLVLKNQVVFGTVNAGADAYESAVRDLSLFMGRWPNAVRSLITGRYAIDDYEDVLLQNPGGIKNVISVTTD